MFGLVKNSPGVKPEHQTTLETMKEATWSYLPEKDENGNVPTDAQYWMSVGLLAAYALGRGDFTIPIEKVRQSGEKAMGVNNAPET
jgi:hypothetical protein